MKTKRRRGFTLLELMVTVAILVFAIGGLFTSFMYSALLRETSANLVKASTDAQFVLEQMKGVSYSALSAYVPPALNSLPNENVTLQKNIGARIAEVTVNVSWTERGRNRNFALTTRFAR